MNAKPQKHHTQRGFALVVTLTLMILLSILALGMLSLSSVALRTSGSTAARNTAQANARLALMMAIGELQKNAGSDTRVTANADILDTPVGSAPVPPRLVLGVWKSWEGTDHNADGRPIIPAYGAKKQNGSSGNGRFLSWLVSGVNTNDVNTVPNIEVGASKATLVGEKSVGSDAKLQVHLDPVPLNKPNDKGAYAWWVGGENMKARLPVPPIDPPSSVDAAGQWASRLKSHSTADPKPFGLDVVLSDSEPAKKAITRQQINLISQTTPPISQKFFHDLSATSVGLQTNTATGGWKKDMSLFTENSALNSGSIPTSGLPLFRVQPDKEPKDIDLTTLASTGNVRAPNSVFYPWSDYRGTASHIPIYQHAAVASWNNLIDYTLLYKKVNSGANSIATESTAIGGDRYNFLHKVRILPVIARVQWVYSYGAGSVTVPTTPPAPVGNLEPRLILTPVITMWNPYNVAITAPQLTFNIPKPLPTALRFKVGTTQYLKDWTLTAGGSNYPNTLSSRIALNYQTNSGFTLKPGETRIFSPTSGNPLASPTTGTGLLPQVELSPDYRSGGGNYFTLKDDNGMAINAPPNSTIKAEVKFDTTYNDAPVGVTKLGVGVYVDMRIGGQNHLAYRMIYEPAVATAVYPPVTDLATSNPLINLASNPSSFLTTIFGARMASNTHIPAKGFIQSSPLVNYTAMGGKDEVEATIGRHYRGTAHPVNSPFDYSFAKVTGSDALSPQSNAATQRGFIVTGFGKNDGLSRCVIAEIPTRPLQSLGELQNWDLRYENPIPPFAFNLIGNSSATPLIGANSVIAAYSDSVNLQHDDSYCANHLLFDDWFFSSIAPDPDSFGTSGRDLRTVYTDFINGKDLPNYAYRAINLDAGGNASALFTQNVDTADSWKTIASRLEVEGMFNVNSTSETAWRAILGHARGQKIPFLKETAGAISVSLSGETDYATSRFSVAGETNTSASALDGSSGTFNGANQFTGYRVFTNTMIDALAKEMVNQVRERGPFLSLSEFVNRQLSSGNLALAGAIQAALEKTPISDPNSPYSEISNILPREPATANPRGDGEEYEFSDAAVGESVFGLPGWTRQADILRPLAPTLTVRDDTFTIRAYGDARAKNGTDILATAVCEAVVRRTRDYVDPTDAADLATAPTSQQNKDFGRRFTIVSFRWLTPGEI